MVRVDYGVLERISQRWNALLITWSRKVLDICMKSLVILNWSHFNHIFMITYYLHSVYNNNTLHLRIRHRRFQSYLPKFWNEDFTFSSNVIERLYVYFCVWSHNIHNECYLYSLIFFSLSEEPQWNMLSKLIRKEFFSKLLGAFLISR